MDTIKFAVPGRPMSKGSKTARVVGHGRAARAIMVELGDMKTKTLPAGRLTEWMGRISWMARSAMHGRDVWPGPVAMSADFVLPLPPSYLLKSGRLAKGARCSPCGPPDLDKLVRAVGDACTGIIFTDDARITHFRPPFGKRWAHPGKVGGVFLEFDFLDDIRPEWEPSR